MIASVIGRVVVVCPCLEERRERSGRELNEAPKVHE